MYKEFETVLKMEAAGGNPILPSWIAPVDR